MNIKVNILATLCVAAGLQVFAVKPQIKVMLDSNYIEMGRVTPLHIQVIDQSAEPGQVIVPFDSVPREVEVVDARELPPLKVDDTESAKKLYTAVYMLQSFDSGLYRIPPLMYVSGHDTVYSNSLMLKVMPVDVSEMQDIDPSELPESLGSKWYDWIPDWLTDYWGYYLVALLIIIGGICTYLILSKKVTVKIMPTKKPRDPYEVAVEKLAQLKDEQLWEHGQEKAFYTELTDILREYLDKRFGINAMEMTSTQILNAIRGREDTRMTASLMQQILEIADFVKFARVQPLREDNIHSFEAARQFVEDTKPVPVAEEDNKSDSPTA